MVCRMDICQEETEFKWLDAAKKYEQELESEPQSGFMAGATNAPTYSWKY